jgi:formyl-CoA transferase
MFRERFRSRPRDHWLARLEAEDLLCAPVRDMREVLVDPQTVHNAMVMEGPAAGGTRYRFIASPIEMSAASATLNRVPPRLGEHTDEILAEAVAGAAKGRS